MTTEEKRGRKLLLIIALVIGIPNLFRAISTLIIDGATSSVAWLYVLFPVILPWLLYKGYRWARGYLVISLVLGGCILILASLVQLAAGGRLAQAIAVLLIAFVAGCVNLCAGIVLARSKAIDSYVDSVTQSRAGLTSLMK